MCPTLRPMGMAWVSTSSEARKEASGASDNRAFENLHILVKDYVAVSWGRS
jgi:hypothetical protein